MRGLTGEELQQRLSSPGPTDSLRAELQEFLCKSANSQQCSEHRVVCDRILRICIQRIGEGEPWSEHLNNLVALAEVAYRGYKASASPQKQLYVERIIFHLLRSIASRGVLVACGVFAEHLYQSLVQYSPASLVDSSLLKGYEPVLKNSFDVIWKSVEQAERGSQVDCQRAFSLRLQAIRFLALLEGLIPDTTCCELSSSSLVTKYFAMACNLYESRQSSLDRKEALYIVEQFRTVLLKAVAEEKIWPESCGHQRLLCVFELGLQLCRTLCKAGHAAEASKSLLRIQSLVKRETSGDRSAWFVAALSLCGVAASLTQVKSASQAPKGAQKATSLIDRAVQALGKLTEGDYMEHKAVIDSCHYLISVMDDSKGDECWLGLEELLSFSAFFEAYSPLLCKQTDKLETSLSQRSWGLKQLYRNLQIYISKVHDLLLGSQTTGCPGAERLLPSCKRTVEKMKDVEGLLSSEGQSKYAGIAALCDYNLAYGFYSHKLYAEAVEIVLALYRQLRSACSSTQKILPPDRVPMFFKLFVECCRKAGDLERAMEAVTTWLMLEDHGPDQIVEPVALWVSVKVDAVKSGNEELYLRTLKDAFEPWDLEPAVLMRLLTEELRVYKTLRMDTAQERFNVICDLIKISADTKGLQHHRAIQLIELAQVLCYRDFKQNATCTALECVEEALGLLDSLPDAEDTQHQIQDDKAHALLWLYICDLEAKIQKNIEQEWQMKKVMSDAPLLTQADTNDLNYEDERQDALSLGNSINFNLKAESTQSKPLDDALALWKSVFSHTPIRTLRSTEQTVGALHIMAALYRLMDKPLQAIESYTLILRVLSAESDWLGMVHVLCHLTKVLLLLGCVSQARLFLDKADSCLISVDSNRSDYLLLRMTCLSLRSQLLCATRQVPEGLALLLEVLQCPSLQKSSKVWYLLKANVLQLVASYMSLPRGILPAKLRQNLYSRGWRSPEAALTDCHRLLCGVVVLLHSGLLSFGKSGSEPAVFVEKGESLLQKWLVLDDLQICSKRLVQLLGNIGSVQEAKMFCLEGLKLASKLHCVRRCVDFLVSKAELELQRSEAEACKLDLDQALFLLESCVDFGHRDRVKSRGKIQPKKRREAKRNQEVPEEAGKVEDQDFLRVQPFLCLTVGSCSQAALTASPVLKSRQTQQPPSFMTHSSSCCCLLCCDVMLSAAGARWVLVLCELEVGRGRSRESQRLLEELRERCKRQRLQFSQNVQHLMTEADVEAKQSDSGPDTVAVLDGPIARVHLQLSSLSLGSHPLSRTWKILEEGLEFLTLELPDARDLEPVRAGLLLHKAVSLVYSVASDRRCELPAVFQAAWQRRPWTEGITSKPTAATQSQTKDGIRITARAQSGSKASVAKASVSESARAKGRTGKASSSKQNTIDKEVTFDRDAETNGKGKASMTFPTTPAPRVKGKPQARNPQRARVLFEIFEDCTSSSPEWKPTLPPVNVPRRARSRLKQVFDDSDVEELVEERPKAEAPGTDSRARGEAGNAPGKRPARGERAKRTTAKPRPVLKKSSDRGKGRGGARTAVTEPEKPERGERKPESLELSKAARPEVAVPNDISECERLRRDSASSMEPNSQVLSSHRRANGCGLPQLQAPVTPTDVGDLDAVYSCLSQACDSISHCPPSTLYSSICQLMALCRGLQDPHTTAYLLSESVAITARHQMISNLHKKLQRDKKERALGVMEYFQGLSLHEGGEAGLARYLAELHSLFQFSPAEPARWLEEQVTGFKLQLQNIPEGVTVCMLALVSVHPGGVGDLLLLTRLERNRSPVTVWIPSAARVASLLREFDDILKEQKEVSDLTELKAWWEGRTELDRRMKTLVELMESDGLGCWKGLLLPSVRDPAVGQEAAYLGTLLEECGCRNVDVELLTAVLGSSYILTPEDTESLTEALCGDGYEEVRIHLQEAVERLRETSAQPRDPSSQLVLILDKNLQRLPWESVPILRTRGVTRVPSLPFLLSYMVTKQHGVNSVMTEGVDPTSVFYVLNPQGNLPNTEKTFKDWFQRKAGWEGVIRTKPSEEQLRSALCDRDLYVYAGHGAGVSFLEGREIQKLQCRAASLLFGCSSAALAVRGNLEGAGIALKYMMAGCPLLLGNLWDVTDKDIDRYMEELLQSWLRAGSDTSILHHVARARQAPKLKYLIGAAPVVYGLNLPR